MKRIILALGILLATGPVLSSAPLNSKPRSRGESMDYGAALACIVLFPPKEGEPTVKAGPAMATEAELARIAARKGLVIRLDEAQGIFVCYDLDHGKPVAAWKGALRLAKTNLASYKGYASGAAEIEGEMLDISAVPDEQVEKPLHVRGYHPAADGVILHLASEDGSATYRRIALKTGADGRPAVEVRAEEKPPEPGPARWAETIEVRGRLGKDDDAYTVDTIPLPEKNPWNAWMRLTALDFFSDGRAAVSTLNGDVWLVSGLDEKLEAPVWKRFASGLHEPLGLRIVKDQLYVGCKNGIWRLHDRNGDAEADYYELFHSERTVWPSYHTFAYDLQTDAQGNFYYATGGHALPKERPHHGHVHKVSADGAKSEEIGDGFRAPNGLTVGPDGSIYVSDNQGQWIPASKINLVRPGGFYGHVSDPRLDPNGKPPERFDQPICYIPKAVDNSSGGGVWCENDRWGPYQGRMLHTSFGAAALYAVLQEKVGEVAQGGVVKFPLRFESGVQRARFAPHDGQLYLVGCKGWESRAAKDGCLQRVRYTGKPVYMPASLRAVKDGIEIGFAVPLDPKSATDPGSYAIEQWNYEWTAVYDAPIRSVANPEMRSRDTVEITAVKLSDDRKTVTLQIPGLQPVMQMVINANVDAADGGRVRFEIANTIHAIGK